MTAIKINGTVAPGFESVKALYLHNMQSLAEKETQLCVYHQGKKVIDLWASVDNNQQFTGDSLVNVFSSGKSLEAIALASLVGKGLLDYDAKITEYWPEFGSNGKHELSVSDLMRHEGGLAALDQSIDPEDLISENIKQNQVGRILENHSQKFRKNGKSRREYHAVTRGWIANEVFRRVDPDGRTIGEFYQQDISGPLNIDVIIGVKSEDLDRRASVSPLPIRFQLLESMKPKFLGRKMELNFFQLVAKLIRLLRKARHGTTGGSPSPFTGMKSIGFFNKSTVAMGESPSANAHCSARGLSTIASMMSTGGNWEGTQYLNAIAWQAIHEHPNKAEMGLGVTTFTQGGLAKFDVISKQECSFAWSLNTGREGFFGWMGLGGSIFQWHPTAQIGFAYVPTSLNVLDIFNERGKAYQTEVLRCIENLGTST